MLELDIRRPDSVQRGLYSHVCLPGTTQGHLADSVLIHPLCSPQLWEGAPGEAGTEEEGPGRAWCCKCEQSWEGRQ